jgi:hypothetical protein
MNPTFLSAFTVSIGGQSQAIISHQFNNLHQIQAALHPSKW